MMPSDKTAPQRKRYDYGIYTAVYDIFYDTHVDTDILDKCWDPSWTHVLEVGVGTGRLIPYYKSKPLGKYVGLDISPEMFERIDKTLLDDTYRCFCMGIHDYHAQDHFDLIHYSYNTFNYVLSLEDACQELSKCSELLSDHGVVVLDMTFPGCVTRGVSPDYQTREQVTRGRTTHLLKCKDEYDAEDKIETRYLKYVRFEGADTTEELDWTSTRRFYPLADLLQVAESAGLSIVSYDIYGNTNPFFGRYEGYFAFFEKKPF